ncbi:MAG: hypothetical protein WCD37_02325 [Chloroflexia bacterium]
MTSDPANDLPPRNGLVIKKIIGARRANPDIFPAHRPIYARGVSGDNLQ